METAARGATTSLTSMSAVLSMSPVNRVGRIGPVMLPDGRGGCDACGGSMPGITRLFPSAGGAGALRSADTARLHACIALMLQTSQHGGRRVTIRDVPRSRRGRAGCPRGPAGQSLQDVPARSASTELAAAGLTMSVGPSAGACRDDRLARDSRSRSSGERRATDADGRRRLVSVGGRWHDVPDGAGDEPQLRAPGWPPAGTCSSRSPTCSAARVRGGGSATWPRSPHQDLSAAGHGVSVRAPRAGSGSCIRPSLPTARVTSRLGGVDRVPAVDAADRRPRSNGADLDSVLPS